MGQIMKAGWLSPRVSERPPSSVWPMLPGQLLSETSLSPAISGLLRTVRGLSDRELSAIGRVQLVDEGVTRHGFELHVALG